MPLTPESLPFAVRLKVGSDAALAVRPSDGKLVGCNEGGDEFDLDAGGGTITSTDGSIAVTGSDIQVDPSVRGEITDAQADATQALSDAADAQATADAAVPQTRTWTAGNGMTGGGDGTANRTFDVVGNADGSILANANDVQVGVLATDAQHGNRGGGGIHANATTSTAGFMSGADKLKLDGLAYSTGAMFFSPVDYMIGQNTFVRNGGNFTTGIGFQLTSGSLTITGIRFYWVRNASDRTIKCSVFNGAGTNLATVDVAVTATGTYIGTFASPITITQADAATTSYFKAAIWEKSGADYTRFSGNPAIVPTFPWVGGAKIIWKNWNAFAAGDANPSGSGTEYYPVEPIFT